MQSTLPAEYWAFQGLPQLAMLLHDRCLNGGPSTLRLRSAFALLLSSAARWRAAI
jgi:hypothetical protein